MLRSLRNPCNQLGIIYGLGHNIICTGSDFFLQPFNSLVQMLDVRIKCSADHKIGVLLQRLAGKSDAVIELLDHPDNLE
ncbi:hypothetical protein D3C75_1185680 [compost metagenome]